MAQAPVYKKLRLAEEHSTPDEHIYIERMITDLRNHLEELYPEGQEMRRHAHPKMHGCVNAEFTILDDIDASLKTGIFKVPKTYDALIRFSNGYAEVRPDAKKDVRGMAIKLFNVAGKKLMNSQESVEVQDFIMIDHEVFMSKTLKEFHKVMHAVAMGKGALILFLLNPAHFPFLKRLIKSQKQCRNVLDSGYWSVTPYLFGEGRAVKYHVAPANDRTLKGDIVPSDNDYLRTNMVNTLAETDVFFDFFIQVQTDPHLMPVEDPTVKWNSPFIKVARIKIPRQQFDTDERRKMAENLSFSPWHSLEEHRPLGAFNRARKAIYFVMSEFRHLRNANTKKS